MADRERIIGAFLPVWKTGKTALRPNGTDPIAAPRKNFMRIRLMTNVPHNPVVQGGKHIVQGDRQLHRTEIGGEVAAVFQTPFRMISVRISTLSRRSSSGVRPRRSSGL